MSFSQGLGRMKENGTDIVESKMRSTPIAMVAPELKHAADLDTGISKTCAVLGCDDSKNLSCEEFFRFPEDEDYRQLWTNLTGRNNWTPTDYSYICIQHFSVDCFTCDSNNDMVLVDKAVPSLKLPKHVLEVEYIEEDTLDNEDKDDYFMDEESDYEGETEDYKYTVNGTDHTKPGTSKNVGNVELLQLFSEVQQMQRKAIGIKEKLKYTMKIHQKQNRFLNRLNQIIEMKRDVLKKKQKRKSRFLLTLQDRVKEDSSGLVMAMPAKYTDDLKNFSLSIYKYSPQAYIFLRNTLRTMLPSTDVLESWLNEGYQPKNVISSSNLVKLTAEQTESELSCRISLR